jgi:hypothetical protein
MKAAKAVVHALEFECQAPLRFYEHCASCPRFHEDCPDLALGREILRGKKKVVYNGDARLEDEVNVGDFRCLAPLYYFEKSRKNCAHEGRCREEGLLLALLSGKKSLDYSQKSAIQLPVRKEGPKRRAETEEKTQGVLVS